MSGTSKAYVVQYAPKTLEELAKLDKSAARRIVRVIDVLTTARDRLVPDRLSAISTCGASA